jgi:hypothetical protein
MRLSKTSLKSFLTSILLIVQYTLLLLYLLSPNNFNTFLYISIFFSFISIFFVVFISNRKLVFWAILSIFIIALSFSLNLLLIGNITEKLMVRSLIVNFSIALLLNTGSVSRKIGFLIYLIFLLVILAAYIRSGDVQEIFPRQSKNYLTFYALVFSFPYVTTFIKIKQKPPILYVISFIILGVISFSRAGTIMGLVFFVGLFFLDSETNWKKRIKKLFYLVILSIIGIYMLQYIDSFEYIVNRFVEEGIQDSNRLEAWKEYIFELKSLKNVFLGVPLNDLRFVSIRLAGSLHNSFLQSHATGGLIYLLFNIIVLYLMTSLYIKKKNYIGLLIVFVFVLRSFFDTNYPGAGLGDIILYYYYFNYMLEQKESNSELYTGRYNVK